MKAKENPFNSSRILTLRFRPQNFRWDEFLARLKSLDYRGAVTGPEGSGKTTLFDHLEPELSTLGFNIKRLRLSKEENSLSKRLQRKFFSNLTGKDIIMLDGAESLGLVSWSLFKLRAIKAGGLLITSHSKGMYPTVAELSTNENLLADIVKDLLGNSFHSSPIATNWLFKKHEGNLRMALFELYDIYAAEK